MVVALVLMLPLVASLAAADDGWSGRLRVSAGWLDIDGSADGFRTQHNLDDGLTLESFRLEGLDDGARFELEAWGFGEAEPTSHGRLRMRLSGPWTVSLDYDRRESFFALADPERERRHDAWDVGRWRGRVQYDGWAAAEAYLEIRRVDRSGTVDRPLYGLNELYPATVRLDESMTEATLGFRTRTLPFTLRVEQSLAEYTRENRLVPAGDLSLDGADPDLLDDAATRFDDEQQVPTTRADISWSGDRLELAASGLWSSAELDRTGAGWTVFSIDGGDVGSVEFIDTLVGSAGTDTLAGTVRVAADLGGEWRLRVRGRYSDRQTDGRLLGERLIRIANPLGETLDLPGVVDERSVFDATDSRVDVELSHRWGGWRAWVGGFTTSRDVSWSNDGDGGTVSVDRESTGGLAGAAYTAGSTAFSAEYEHGGFEKYVFRTDPETVDRVTVRARTSLSEHVSGSVYGSFESGSNPASVADRSREARAVGVSCTLVGGESVSAGADISWNSISTHTGLVLPSGDGSVSDYDLDLLAVTAFGEARTGAVRLLGSATWLADDGDTWPVAAWDVTARAMVPGPSGSELGGFVQLWKYDEDRAEVDDFDAVRYGVIVGWSF